MEQFYNVTPYSADVHKGNNYELPKQESWSLYHLGRNE